MGTWNRKLFSNDTTCDIRDTYIEFLKIQLTNEEAYKKTYLEFSELFGTDEEPLFWYAMADTQWQLGRLMPEVKEKALSWISQKGGLELWEDSENRRNNWVKTLYELEEKLCSTMPEEVKINIEEPFVRNPWNIGDIYAYQFHTDLAEKAGLYGKYILFQKIGDCEYYKNEVYSVVQLYDKVFDTLSAVDEIENCRVLPLIHYKFGFKKEDCIPSFQFYLQNIMLYEKKCRYPKKHFTFVGNKTIPAKEYLGNQSDTFYLERNGMEEWIIDFYLSWQGIDY